MLELRTLMSREFWRFFQVAWGTVLAPILTALLFFTVFNLSIGKAIETVNGIPFLTFLAPGLIMMSMVQNAFANNTMSIMIAKNRGGLVDFIMAPLSSLELLVGFISGGVCRALMIGALGVTVFHLLVGFDFVYPVYIAIFAFLGALFMAQFGVLAAIISNSFDTMANITNFFITPMIFLSGTFYSIQTLPETLAKWAYVNPFFNMIDGFRYGLTGVSDGSPFFGAFYLIGINGALFIVIWLILNSGYKTRT